MFVIAIERSHCITHFVTSAMYFTAEMVFWCMWLINLTANLSDKSQQNTDSHAHIIELCNNTNVCVLHFLWSSIQQDKGMRV